MLKPFRGSLEQKEEISLPLKFLNDHHLVYPLAILDYRRPSAKAPWEVLVQWQGLSPNETSWEDWTQLQRDYHFEDKVILQGSKDDKNIEASSEIENAKEGVLKEEKPKGKIMKPPYLNDYVWG